MSNNNNKFYICEKCGNVVGMIHSSGVTPHCCGQKMSVLEAGVVEASREKHVPEVEVSEGKVKAQGSKEEILPDLFGTQKPCRVIAGGEA